MNPLKLVCEIQGLNYRKVKRIYDSSNEVQKKILNLGFERIIAESKLKQAV